MNDDTGSTSKKCKAMIDAGIDNPDSYKGIHFCWQRCPYPDYCVVFEPDQDRQRKKASDAAAFAKRLHKHGVSVIDISLIISKTTRIVRSYLKR